MARKLTDRVQTDDFIKRVLEKAKHAPGVHGPVITIYNKMMTLILFERDKIEFLERGGEMARTTWVTLQGCRMVFTYDYDGKRVLLKNYSTQREILTSFYWNETREATLASLIGASKELGVSC